jgi:hypothetical protein
MTPDETPKPSDQLPEDGPAEQVPDDVPQADEGAARESSSEQAREQSDDLATERGYRGEEEQEAYEQRAPGAADEEVGGG